MVLLFREKAILIAFLLVCLFEGTTVNAHKKGTPVKIKINNPRTASPGFNSFGGTPAATNTVPVASRDPLPVSGPAQVAAALTSCAEMRTSQYVL